MPSVVTVSRNTWITKNPFIYKRVHLSDRMILQQGILE